MFFNAKFLAVEIQYEYPHLGTAHLDIKFAGPTSHYTYSSILGEGGVSERVADLSLGLVI